MSHLPLRHEKNCLNCGATVTGRYCPDCGQENVVPKETFWHMVTHFFYDITHFDSKFFETVKDLLFRPGFLTKEYMAGRRASYLHPVKMYVFTSAVFFLLFFSVFATGSVFKSNYDTTLTREDRAREIRKTKQKLEAKPGEEYLLKQLALLRDSSRPVTVGQLEELEGYSLISISGSKYRTQLAYDSAQQALPASRRDGWFKRRLVKKEIELNEAYRKDPQQSMKKLGDNILHRLPYMLFVSLPLFALLLQLVYIRRKQFYYADHGVFTIHLYVFTFILLTLVFLTSKLEDALHTGYLGILVALLFIGLLAYLYKAMRNFYGQGRAKTIAKFLLVFFLSLLMMLILFAVFSFFSTFII